MRIAVADLGTNTFNLIVAETNQKGFDILSETREVVKLTAGSGNSNKINKKAVSRAINAALKFKGIIAEYSCDHVILSGTDALRSQLNGPELKSRMEEIVKNPIQIISGEREAELIGIGVLQSFSFPEPALIMDIGGGSTEFIITEKNQIMWKTSLPLGVSRLMETLNPSDPLTKINLNSAFAYIQNLTFELKKQITRFKPDKLIGASGAFDTLMDIEEYDSVNGNLDSLILEPFYEFKPQAINNLYNELIAKNIEERKEIPGMTGFRADMIVMGIILIKSVLDIGGIKRVYRSSYSLKEGIIFDFLNNHLNLKNSAGD